MYLHLNQQYKVEFIMSKIASIFLLILINHCSIIYCQSDAFLIQSIIDQTNLDSLTYSIEILSGVREWNINDTSYKIISRYADYVDNDIAAEYLKNRFVSLGMDTYDQKYSETGRNIYAIQQGYLYPDQYYIICGHYDSMPEIPPAPGADDNASGVSTVLEAARILRDYNPAYSIIYALWDEEETVGQGSLYFAEQASLNNMDILGVINIDMIGFDKDDNIFEVHQINGTASQIASVIDLVKSYFNFNMISKIKTNGLDWSDHGSFYVYGYDAILLIEYLGRYIQNYHWHTNHDKLIFFNLPYFHNLTKIAIGALTYLAFDAVISDVEGNTQVNDFSLSQNFPNPFNPGTTIKYHIPELCLVTINIYDVLGNEIATLVNEEKPVGSYTVHFDSNGLPSGTYFYQIKAGSFIETKKIVLLR